MQPVFRTMTFVAAATMMLSACGNRDATPELMNIVSNNNSPDEFAILPSRPLEAPEDYASLPTPTPGGTNRTDPTPEADAVAALGGNRSSITRDGSAGPDGSLVTQTTRFGLAADIRQVLASEDLNYRRANNGRLLERLFNVNVYFEAYEAESLDQHAELLRLRRLGVRTAAAPPDPELLDN